MRVDTVARGLGRWTGADDVSASADPPFGLPPEQVPMLVSIGFDDNAYSGLPGSGGEGGMSWALQMMRARKNADGSLVRASFYATSKFADTWISESPTLVKRAWHEALAEGHEIGNHSRTHPDGSKYSEDQWIAEISSCSGLLSRPFDPAEPDAAPDPERGIGLDPAQIQGFRAPFLVYNDHTLTAVQKLGFRYDCSLQEGYQPDQDGTNYNWPFTLDSGSPGHEILALWTGRARIGAHPGLWELPVYPVIVPPDAAAERYGVPPGLRERVGERARWFSTRSGKVCGFDQNLWVDCAMSKVEFLATLKYTLDLRLSSNRAPFLFGAHTDCYSSKFSEATRTPIGERREAIEELVDYATRKSEVRMVPLRGVLDWVRNPVTL